MLRKIIAIALAFGLFFAETPSVFADTRLPEFSLVESLETIKQHAWERLPKSIEFPDISAPDLGALSERLQQTLATASEGTRQTYTHAREKFDSTDLYSLIIGSTTAYETLSQALQWVPQDFTELLREMPKVAKRVKRAGLRSGDPTRTPADAFALFRKVPGAALLDGTERPVRVWLSNKDASHIQSYIHGGSGNPSNIFWELRGVNRARGGTDTTQLEVLTGYLYNGAEAVVENSATIAQLGLQATSYAVLVDALVEAELHILDLASGEIGVDEFLGYIQQSAQQTALSAAAFYTLTLLAVSVFPGLVPALSAPTLVTASQVILGSRLTLPLLRLLPQF